MATDPPVAADDALARLHRGGARFGTLVDIGCADGHYAVGLAARGLIDDAVVVNVDARDIYVESLKKVQAVLGGHYRIAALSDREGTVALHTGAHPYWASIRGPDDLYWQRLNRASGQAIEVPATTLDRLAAELRLPPPFLLKLDVQGAEPLVLAGAADVLRETDALILEVDVADFAALTAQVAAHGLSLYDLTSLNRLADGTLGWFYAVYVGRRLAPLQVKSFWHPDQAPAVVEAQVRRRQAIRGSLDADLEKAKNRRFLASLRRPPAP